MGSALGIGVLLSYGVSNVGALMAADRMTNKLITSTKGADAQLSKLAMTMQRVATGALIMAAGMAAINVTVGNVRAYANYQESMLDLQGLLRNTGAEMERFATKAREMSRTYAYTSGDVADAMWRIASAGFTQNEVLAMTESVLRYATIGNMETADAAYNLSNVMRSFSIPATEAEQTLDKIVATMSRYQLTMADFETGFATWGMVAANTNQSLEEMLALWGSFTSMGLSVSRSGMMVKMMLTNLIGASPEARELRRALGVELIDPVTGEMRSLLDIMEDLQTAFANPVNDKFLTTLLGDPGEWASATEGELYALTKFFGRRAVAGYLGTVGLTVEREDLGILQSFAALRADAEFIASQHGYGAEYAATIMTGINYTVENIKSSFTQIKELLGAALGTQVGALLEDLLAAINATASFLETHPEIATAIAAGTLAFGVIATILGAVLAIAAIVSLIPAAVLATIGAAIATAALIILAIVAVVALVIIFWDDIISFLSMIWDQYLYPLWTNILQPIFARIWESMKAIWENIKKLWDSWGPSVINALKFVGGALIIGIAAVIVIIAVVLGAIAEIAKAIFDIYTWVDTAITDVLVFLWNLGPEMDALGIKLIELIIGAFEAAVKWVKNFFLGDGGWGVYDAALQEQVDAASSPGGGAAMAAAGWPVDFDPKTILTGWDQAGSMSVKEGLHYLHDDEEVVQAGGHSNRGGNQSSISIGDINITLQGSGNTEDDARRIADKVMEILATEAEATIV